MKDFCVVVLILFAAMIWLGSFTVAEADDILYGCAKFKGGKLRLVGNPSECKKSEYSVILNATSAGGGGSGLDLSQTYTKECFNTYGCSCDNNSDWVIQGWAKCACALSEEGRTLTDAGSYPDVPNTYYAACWNPVTSAGVEPCVIRIRCVDVN